MTLPYRILAGLLLLLAVFGSGYWYGTSGVKPVTVTEIQTKEVKGDTTIEYKDRIVTVTKTVKADGTVTTSTTTENKQKEEEKHVQTIAQEKETKVQTAPTVPLPRYDLGLSWTRPLVSLAEQGKPKWEEFGLEAGTRVSSSPFWLEAGYTGKRELYLGVRVEW